MKLENNFYKQICGEGTRTDKQPDAKKKLKIKKITILEYNMEKVKKIWVDE